MSVLQCQMYTLRSYIYFLIAYQQERERDEGHEGLANELGCGVGFFPTKYLGLLLSTHFKSLWILDSIEERYKRRLTSWKSSFQRIECLCC